MPTYTFMVTRHDFYQVTAPLLSEAKKILEECDDLADYDVTLRYLTLEDIQPKFELAGITGKVGEV